MDWMKSVVGIAAVIVEEKSTGTYIAEAKEDTPSASSPVWRVRRVKTSTSNGVTRTTVAWAGGTCGFCHPASDMSSLTYADY